MIMPKKTVLKIALYYTFFVLLSLSVFRPFSLFGEYDKLKNLIGDIEKYREEANRGKLPDRLKALAHSVDWPVEDGTKNIDHFDQIFGSMRPKSKKYSQAPPS